ncbi:YjeF N-terminal domain-containing protein [Scheffersomyces xylosifermentans]|uniref:YjeF N-terminal domain-containing protein n=1 Tax=Scheffersomyces xylosifermentans TaxID=1304137 RepID=UPI00315CB003
MTEFINYRVDVTLKDGTKSTGTITHVDSSQISLGNAIQSFNPNHAIANLSVPSSNIADLKVIQLPPQLLKNAKGKAKNNNAKYTNNENNPGEIRPGSTAPLLDDAIVFAKQGSVPPSKDAHNGNDRSSYNTPRGNYPNSRAGTPKLRSVKVQNHQNYSTAGSVDPDWGDESDVQEIKSAEFDFAANLAMFDKKSVFADFQKKDTVNPGDRLVGHNKVENVAKQRKEKYDNDEMVLDTSRNDNWDNIGSASKKLSISERANNSTSNLHKDSHLAATQNLKLVHADNLSPIPLASPVQLLEIERLSAESYGVSPSVMTEVCASNLSQLIANHVLGGSTRLSNKKNHNLPPLVLLLIGSSRCGSRAFATGRHLTNHGMRVLAFVINNEESDKNLTEQWTLFENCGGKIISSNVNELLNIINHQLDTPVELIIDALQGYDDHLEDVFYQEEDQQELRSLMNWCNEPHQSNKVMSLDIPSGIDGGSGTLSDDSLKLNCKWCISMGLPITGLILAYKNGHLESGDVQHYLIDVGIPNKVYSSKGNLRKFDKFWYSAESSIKLELSND